MHSGRGQPVNEEKRTAPGSTLVAPQTHRTHERGRGRLLFPIPSVLPPPSPALPPASLSSLRPAMPHPTSASGSAVATLFPFLLLLAPGRPPLPRPPFLMLSSPAPLTAMLSAACPAHCTPSPPSLSLPPAPPPLSPPDCGAILLFCGGAWKGGPVHWRKQTVPQRGAERGTQTMHALRR